MISKPNEFIIAIDTREQRPYTFQEIKPDPPETTKQGLKTGDYSVVGLTDIICCERKEKSDLFNSMGTNRTRFKKEIIRMSKMQYSALIIECSLASIFTNPPSRSHMSSKAVFRSLISWSVKYNIHIFPAWSREAGEKIVYLLLKNFFDNMIKEKKIDK